MHRPNRLSLDRQALQSNWRWLQSTAGVEAGAAVKADGYGLGIHAVVDALLEAGCREFFVSSWVEAAFIHERFPEAAVVVLHGVGPDDVLAASDSSARPVLNSVKQIEIWKEIADGRACDIMFDTGMNRIGLSVAESEALTGLRITTVHSHLACADEDHPLNKRQLERFRIIKGRVTAARFSLANSGGIMLGPDYSFDLVRPGLALYGGIPRPEGRDHIRRVVSLQAQVVQRRQVQPGETVGYGGSFQAKRQLETAIINLGYGDGYCRGFQRAGFAIREGKHLPVVGRVSMDLTAIDCSLSPEVKEGDWLDIDFDLEGTAETTGISQYELLTGLNQRFERNWF